MHGKKVHPLPDTPFTKAVLKHVEVVAHKIATKYHRNKDEEEDIRSQFVERLMRAFPKYNPELSSYYTFAQQVVDRERGHVEYRLNRDHLRRMNTVSLYEPVNDDDDDPLLLIDTIEDVYYNPDRMRERIHLHLVFESVSRLTGEVMLMYMAGSSWTEITEHFGIPPEIFFRKTKPAVIEEFRTAYLK